MSRVSIPAAAQPGQLVCDMELKREDAQIMVDKLKAALHKLRGITGASPPADPKTAAPSTTFAPHAAPPATPAHQQPPASATAAAAASTPARQQQPAPAAPPGPLPRAGVEPRPISTPATAFSQGAAPAPAPPPPAPRPPGWQLCWTSDAAEHSGNSVTGLAYVPQISGLPGGDGHAGWLISSSSGLLNLWEASPSAGRGEPALMCMHSQGTDFSSLCLDVDPATRMLLAASQDRSGGEWLTCASLEVETLLAPKGRCPMPHTAASRRPGQNCLAAASLHSFGGPLAETCVASYGGGLVVWHVGTASNPAASNAAQAGSGSPKALWKAHDALITCLHKSAFGLALYSGAADGGVHMFNMREKPSRPNAVFTHQGRITGIRQLNDSQLLTTGGDGRLMVWDLRNAAAGALKFCIPDTKPILRMALSPFGDCVALATTVGLHTVDLLDPGCASAPIAAQLRSPVTGLTWNTATSEVIVAGGPGAAGTVSVYKQRLAGY